MAEQYLFDIDTSEKNQEEEVNSSLFLLAVEDKPQDKIFLNSEVMRSMDELEINFLLDKSLAEETDYDGYAVNISDGNKFIRQLREHKITKEVLPAWSDQWSHESRWAKERKYASDSNLRLLWAVDETLVFQSPYIMSLDEELRSIIKDVEWSDDVGGWIFPWFDDDMLERLKELADLYGFEASAAASTILNGRIESELIIDDTILDAKEEGYRIPPNYFAKEDYLNLYEWQARGVLSTLARRRVLLADSPGLGKGGIFVSSFLSEFDLSIRERLNLSADDEYNTDDEEVAEIIAEMSPIVLVCQTSMIMTLAREIEQWWNDATIAVLQGRASDEIPDVNFIICPYSILSHRLEDIFESEPKGLIADECHMLKNPESQVTIAAQELGDYINDYGASLVEAGERDTTLIILASGTPIPNRPAELWSLISILGETDTFVDAALEALSSDMIKQPHSKNGRTKWSSRPMSEKEIFERRWCSGGFGKVPMRGRNGNKGFVGYAWMNFGASNLSELHRILSESVMVRRRKRDVIQLPAPYERIVPTPLNNEEMEEYTAIRDEFREYMDSVIEEYAKEWGVPVTKALRKMRSKIDFAEELMQLSKLTQFVSRTKTRQIVDWVKRFMEQDSEIITRDADKRRKLIVFAHHIDTQNQLINNEELQKYGMAYIIAGQKDVVEQTDRFQKDDDCRLIICYSGAKEGHTLTAAYDVLISEPPPVPSHAEQMACRCYARVSADYEPHEAYVHYAITPDTVDVLQLRRMNLKKGISDAVIDGEDDPSKNDKKNREARTRQAREAEASILMEMVMSGDQSIRIAT